jgi:hypothetical protein
MKKAIWFFHLSIIITGISCNSADNKVSQVASAVCDCFKASEKNMSAVTKYILKKASNATDPKTTLQEEVSNLSTEDQATVELEMSPLSEANDPQSEIGKCMRNVEKKYGNGYTLDQTKTAEKIIKELESRTGCDFTATIMRLGLKIENKSRNGKDRNNLSQ